MDKVGGHAVVIGASMSGLLATRVLSEHYEQVTIVERDACPGTGDPRKGVPQARHAHGILARGVEAIEAIEPGFVDALAGFGALRGDLAAQGIWCHGGRRHATYTSGLRGLLISRPRLEAELLGRVRACPNVDLLERTDALGLVYADGGRRATGVRLLRREDGEAEEVLSADLVVDASGRGSRAPTWLAQAGYAPPPVERVEIDLRYTTRVYRRRPDELGGRTFAIITAAGDLPRSGVALAMEGDRWIVTAGGYGEDPPADPEGFADFLGTLAIPDLGELVREAEPGAGEAVHYRTSASVRRRYERLRRWPAGLLVMGDALCGFNPIYGQGMTVAALEAIALRDLLREGRGGLARRFFRRASRLIDMAWGTAVVSDLGLDAVPGRRTAKTRFVNWYLQKLHFAAQTDPVVASAFLAVANLCAAPLSIMRPAIVGRILRSHSASARGAWGRRGCAGGAGVGELTTPEPGVEPRAGEN